MEIKDCKTCKHATTLYEYNKDNRFDATLKTSGYARCSKPGYKGRTYFVRDMRKGCADYVRSANARNN